MLYFFFCYSHKEMAMFNSHFFNKKVVMVVGAGRGPLVKASLQVPYRPLIF